jgi:hypothetical protein
MQVWDEEQRNTSVSESSQGHNPVQAYFQKSLYLRECDVASGVALMKRTFGEGLLNPCVVVKALSHRYSTGCISVLLNLCIIRVLESEHSAKSGS